ncbi:MAG: YbaN family protein [Acidobacteriota bacterium]|nr:YbaN family protein [Acidobacteriota bacterium]
MIRKLYLVLGLVSLSIGFAGIFLPLVPTTPLVLLAAFFFSRSSPRIHGWLRAHRRFGPILRDWENGQVIRPGAKAASVVLMSGLVGYSVWFVVRSPYLQALLILITLSVSLFVLSRPSTPPARGS